MADKERIAGILNVYRDEIRAKSPKSFAAWQRNRTVMPAGVGSLFRLADPFPMVVKRAKGARLWDADDNEYLDFMLGFSVMILGNAAGRSRSRDQGGAASWDALWTVPRARICVCESCSATWRRA